MVTAETDRQAKAAAKAVQVTYEDLPSIVSIAEAIAADSFFQVSLQTITNWLHRSCIFVMLSL